MISFNSYVPPSQHLLALHPSVFWISTFDQMSQIPSSTESIIIQGGVGRKGEPFKLSNLSSLRSLEIGGEAFEKCHSVVFESEDDEE